MNGRPASAPSMPPSVQKAAQRLNRRNAVTAYLEPGGAK